jgi:ankyrin repeat protein
MKARVGAHPVRGKGQARPSIAFQRQALPRLLLRTTGTSPRHAGEEVAMPTRPLPNDPSFERLRKHAKKLRDAVRAGDAAALAEAAEFHPRAGRATARFTLADAQLTIARSYGFASWATLKQHLAEIEPLVWNPTPPDPRSTQDLFVRLACLTYSGWDRHNPARAVRMLADHPDLVESDVYTAAAAGNVAGVRRFLDQDPALAQAKGGPLHWEPLLYACYSRLDGALPGASTVDVARLLLSRGADPNCGFLLAGSYAFTALTGAFGRGEDWSNQPPHPGCDALARLLLDAGADPNDAQALYNRHFEDNDDHLRLLFEYGLGRESRGPWIKRLTDENASTRTMLVQQLCWAAMKGFRARLKLLVEHGVDLNVASRRDGRTPYEEALRAGHHDIAGYLLRQGAKKIDLDPVETFALDCIAGRRAEAHARLAADPTLLDRLGHEGRVDLLHRAVDANRRDGIRLIVDLGVDINGMVPGTGLDRAALHNAASGAHLDTIALLLELGADPHLRDPTYHAAPIGWALHSRRLDVVDYLLPLANIFDAVNCGGVERASALLRDNPPLANARDEAGNPLVFYLHPETPRLQEMIRILSAHGADFAAQNRDGKTAADRARARGWIEFADLLREAGGRSRKD